MASTATSGRHFAKTTEKASHVYRESLLASLMVLALSLAFLYLFVLVVMVVV